MKFILARPSPRVKALVLMASICLILNCHRSQPPPQTGPKDAGVANSNTGNSNTGQNVQEAKANDPSPEPASKSTSASKRVSETPQEYASSENDNAKTRVADRAVKSDLDRQRGVQQERAVRMRRARRP